ncbi:hypothetical protein [Epibacterium sp. Ofav1-8]|uniref:hypothetical protein n=1 Tax=Epibacterium sp. Ofav1-8 TaxID=2917735 RepID=UPI001EF4D3BC|nr:hypothetical protein [Epibacterium sp. Ofav1-8]MCG7623125.1 hypothetical protein [Epibacterium sp. Ofav1-8]
MAETIKIAGKAFPADIPGMLKHNSMRNTFGNWIAREKKVLLPHIKCTIAMMNKQDGPGLFRAYFDEALPDAQRVDLPINIYSLLKQEAESDTPRDAAFKVILKKAQKFITGPLDHYRSEFFDSKTFRDFVIKQLGQTDAKKEAKAQGIKDDKTLFEIFILTNSDRKDEAVKLVKTLAKKEKLGKEKEESLIRQVTKGRM